MIVYTDYLQDQRVRREAETLAALSDYKVIVLALKKDFAPRTYDIDGVKVLEMNEKKYCGKGKLRYILSYITFLTHSFIACTKLFITEHLDIIHVHNMPDFLVFAGIVPRLFGRKMILDIHDSVPETFMVKFNTSNSLLFKLLCLEELICVSLAHRILCVNHIQRDILVKRGIPFEKITISLNVPDDKRFNKESTNNIGKKGNGKFRMIYHGTATKRLGVDLIISAFAKLNTEKYDFEFHVWAKSGDDLDDFIRLSKELNVDDRINFIRGGVPFERLPQALVGMDIGVIGNRRGIATELMLPVKMLEYIAMGIPVVAPRLRCIEYYFADDMVSFYEPEDIDSMKSAILRLYRDKSMRKIQAEKARAFLDRYGWEKHQMDLINLYRELCG